MQEYIEGHACLEEAQGDIVAAVIFDYEHHDVIEELHTIQHAYQDVINTTSHVHQGEWCLETVFCTGEAARIRQLVYQIRDFDAVGRVKLMLLQRFRNRSATDLFAGP
ncbi:hypothetical protein GCM10009000_007000 [Halobacterium noricense]|uniref:Transcription factor NikR nickel binding C-terminal domain-containing protein n=1 Tax=Haladaptatus pallidirubidus TaxID=1008152 RepID=A0AAV3UPU0_9EURY